LFVEISEGGMAQPSPIFKADKLAQIYKNACSLNGRISYHPTLQNQTFDPLAPKSNAQHDV
jgi:hypothetical protein